MPSMHYIDRHGPVADRAQEYDGQLVAVALDYLLPGRGLTPDQRRVEKIRVRRQLDTGLPDPPDYYPGDMSVPVAHVRAFLAARARNVRELFEAELVDLDRSMEAGPSRQKLTALARRHEILTQGLRALQALNGWIGDFLRTIR